MGIRHEGTGEVIPAKDWLKQIVGLIMIGFGWSKNVNPIGDNPSQEAVHAHVLPRMSVILTFKLLMGWICSASGKTKGSYGQYIRYVDWLEAHYCAH